MPEYVGALHKEMERYKGRMISSVYVGGGTPTLLSVSQIRDLFAMIRNTFNCTRLSEITFEANPESLDDDKLGALKVAGVNRLSIGVQSFCDRNLSYLGRVHNSETAVKAFKRARKYHFSNMGIDLIYGIPGQTPLEWQDDLRKAVSLKPEHISAYSLTVEPGTDLYKAEISVDDDHQAELYEWTMDYMGSVGYEHYEISNWSLPGFKCRHNLLYWGNKEYIGVGVAAASYIGPLRSKNCSNIDEYISKISAGQSAAAELDEIDGRKRASEEMMLKLRCSSGIEESDDLRSKYGNTINKFLQLKLLEKSNGHIRLTKRGFALANQVIREFI